jgi:hypothetical protein
MKLAAESCDGDNLSSSGCDVWRGGVNCIVGTRALEGDRGLGPLIGPEDGRGGDGCEM